jgi:hypothetical protein
MGTVPPRVALARPLPGAAAALLAAIEAGSRSAIARAMTALENGAAFAPEFAAFLSDRVADGTARAHVVGITGPPGAGKSTLINALLGELLTRGQLRRRRRGRSFQPARAAPCSAIASGCGEFGADERVYSIAGLARQYGRPVAHDRRSGRPVECRGLC